MTPRDPDGKLTPSTPQQKLAAHVERVNAKHAEAEAAPHWAERYFAESYPESMEANGWQRARQAPPPERVEEALDWQRAQQVPMGQEDWRAVNAANAARYAKLDDSLDDLSQSFGLDKPKPNPSHKDAFLWLGILASLTLVVLGWYLLAH